MKRDGGAIFALDLDGTVTRREILPVVADELGFANEIDS